MGHTQFLEYPNSRKLIHTRPSRYIDSIHVWGCSHLFFKIHETHSLVRHFPGQQTSIINYSQCTLWTCVHTTWLFILSLQELLYASSFLYWSYTHGSSSGHTSFLECPQQSYSDAHFYLCPRYVTPDDTNIHVWLLSLFKSLIHGLIPFLSGFFHARKQAS